MSDVFTFSLSFSSHVHALVRQFAIEYNLQEAAVAVFTAQALIASRETMTESLFCELSLELDKIAQQMHIEVPKSTRPKLGVVRNDNETAKET